MGTMSEEPQYEYVPYKQDTELKDFFDKLYYAQRRLQANDIQNGTFVIIARGEVERELLETRIIKYVERYFALPKIGLTLYERDDATTVFACTLPHFTFRVAVITLENKNQHT